MFTIRLKVLFIVVIGLMMANELCAQMADSLFVSGFTGDTKQDTLINTLGIVNDSVSVDSISIADTISRNSVNLDTLPPKPIRDTAKYGLYRRVFIEDDSLKIHRWHYNPNTYDFSMSTYDSSLYMLNLHRPANYNGRVTAYLHQVGTAISSHEFFEPNEPTRFLFLQSFTPYMHQAENEEFYNVKKPFTLFEYDGGMKDEQIIHLIHTQNVTRGLNIFFKYDSYGGEGEFVEQKTKNNAGSLGASFIQGRLATHAAWTFSRINVQENGGITDDYFITDSVMNPKEIAVKLTNAKTYIKDRQWFIDQKVGFIRAKESDTIDTGGYWFSLQYTFKRQYSRKYYIDENQQYFNALTGDSLPIYRHNYSGKSTYDSCSYTDQIHQVRLNLEEIKNPYAPFGLYGALGIQKQRYYYFNVDTLFSNTSSTTKTSGYIEVGLYRTRPGLLTFSGSYRQYYAGYKSGDFTLNGEATQRLSKDEKSIALTGNILLEQHNPDHFLIDYQSNHFKWQKDFAKRPITLKIGAKLDIPRFKTTIAGHYALLTNYIYLNSECLPSQADDKISVTDIQLRNHLSGAGFNLVSRINFQKTDAKESVLNLADITAYEALYYERELHFDATHGKMLFQLGIDMSFWTKYNAQAYCPATALFYNQTSTETGNYPFIGAFLNVRIKQVRFFICGHHINYDLFGNRNFFLAPHYPTSKATFSYGIRWPFYD